MIITKLVASLLCSLLIVIAYLSITRGFNLYWSGDSDIFIILLASVLGVLVFLYKPLDTGIYKLSAVASLAINLPLSFIATFFYVCMAFGACL